MAQLNGLEVKHYEEMLALTLNKTSRYLTGLIV
jgi:hypothetical protein